MTGACSGPATDGTAGAENSNDDEALATVVRELAEHLAHAAAITLLAVETDPVRAAQHLLGSSMELHQPVRALALRITPAVLAVTLIP